jgi:hypothetical protein
VKNDDAAVDNKQAADNKQAVNMKHLTIEGRFGLITSKM